MSTASSDSQPPERVVVHRDTTNSLPSLNGEVDFAMRQSVMKAQVDRNFERRPCSAYALAIVESPIFRHAMSCAILLNVIELGTSTDIVDPSWKDVWYALDNTFVGIFAIEMVLKLAAYYPRAYFSNRSNVFDFVLAWLGIADMWVLHLFLAGESSFEQLNVLRIFRLLRLLRMLKVLTIQRQLMVVIEGIAASLSSMFWIGLLLTVIIYTFAIFCVVVIGRAEGGHPNKEKLFGNIPRSMLSLFNITLLTEWPAIVWPLFETQAWIVPVFVVFVIFASCGVLNVIIGVIVERTNQAGSKIREEDVKRHKRKQLEVARQLANLMEELDKDGDAKLTFAELVSGMQVGSLTEMIQGLDLPCGFTLRHLYTLLDEDSDDCLNTKEFVVGMRRLITSNDFQRHCSAQLATAQLKREVMKLKRQLLQEVYDSTAKVLHELRSVQQHLGITPAMEPPEWDKDKKVSETARPYGSEGYWGPVVGSSAGLECLSVGDDQQDSDSASQSPWPGKHACGSNAGRRRWQAASKELAARRQSVTVTRQPSNPEDGGRLMKRRASLKYKYDFSQPSYREAGEPMTGVFSMSSMMRQSPRMTATTSLPPLPIESGASMFARSVRFAAARSKLAVREATGHPSVKRAANEGQVKSGSADLTPQAVWDTPLEAGGNAFTPGDIGVSSAPLDHFVAIGHLGATAPGPWDIEATLLGCVANKTVPMLRSSTTGSLGSLMVEGDIPASPVLQRSSTSRLTLQVDPESPSLRRSTSKSLLRPVASESRLSTPSRLTRPSLLTDRIGHLAAPKQFSLAVGLELSALSPKGRQSIPASLLPDGESPRPPSASTTRPPSVSPRPCSRPCSRPSAVSPRINGISGSPRLSRARTTVLPPVELPRTTVMSNYQLRRLEAQNRADEMKDRFRQLDISGDGYLDLAELTVLLRKGRPEITQREVSALFGKIDLNGDGRVSFEEFVDYIFSVELSAKRATKRKSTLNKWDGPEQLKVNGVWDTETKSALQRFLLEQRTATGTVAKPQNFISGQMNTQQVVVLQEVLMQQRMPSALENGSAFVCGKMNAQTTRAMHEFLMAEETPTAMQLGKAFLDQDFGESTYFALQELLVMYRRSRGTGLHAAR